MKYTKMDPKLLSTEDWEQDRVRANWSKPGVNTPAPQHPGRNYLLDLTVRYNNSRVKIYQHLRGEGFLPRSGRKPKEANDA